MNVDISFSKIENLDTVNKELIKTPFPNIVLWYVGAYGARVEGIDFYRSKLISKVLKINPGARFWLMDLSAWKALKDSEASEQKISRVSEYINQSKHPRVKAILSSSIFKQFNELRQPSVIKYFQDILSRKYLFSKSLNHRKNGLTVGEVFKNKPAIFSNILDVDTGMAYSAIQYVEGCFLVLEIAKKTILEGNVNLIFVLPNDEFEYYSEQQTTFLNDIRFLLMAEMRDQKKTNNLSIKFMPFKYGVNINKRPYNILGKKVRLGRFDMTSITGL